MAKYIAEPFKIKMVEPLKMTTKEERIEKLKEAYKGDNTPVSGRDIASAIIKYTFGTTNQQ